MPRTHRTQQHGKTHEGSCCCSPVQLRREAEHPKQNPRVEWGGIASSKKIIHSAPAYCSTSPLSQLTQHHGCSSTPRRSRHLDVEKYEAPLEQVILRFKGPDCAGCANKIFKCLNSIPGLLRLRTNPLLLQAEFDLNKDVASVPEIINTVQKVTGYDCERIVKKWQELEAIYPEQQKDLIARTYPIGVKDVIFKGKTNIYIQYDAEIIGPRDLLGTAFGTNLRLAPPRGKYQATNPIHKTAYLTLISSILTIPILVLSWAPLLKHKIAYGAVSFALATIIQVVVAGSFYFSAFRSLFFIRTIDMSVLVVLSTTAAYVVSVMSFVYQIKGMKLAIGVYFETSALMVTLIMVGRLVTAYACQRAMESASVRSLQAATACLISPADKEKSGRKEIDTRLLQYGDIFVVKPNCVIVTDGIVVSGASDVDESMMTGEAHWIGKKPGSSVVAGSINRSGTLLIQLTRLPGSNTIDEIASMVDEVAYTKPKIQETADRFAGYFVPVVGLLALMTLFIWCAVGISIQNQSAKTAVLTALSYAISVLVVSCPCAIGLAVPMVMLIASGVGAKRGVVIKSANALQVARHVTHVVFDKTGTLTESHLAISAETYYAEPPSLAAALILGLTANSQHPVARAVANHVAQLGFETATLEHVKTVVGKGIEGTFNNEIIRIGNADWLGVETFPPLQALLSQGLTVSCIAKGPVLLAVFGLAASLRENAAAIVSALHTRNIDVSILSGDESRAVQHAADSLNIPLALTRAKCSPAEKRDYVKSLQQQQRSRQGAAAAVVLFCGDGTNDTAALGQADVGVYIHSTPAGMSSSAADVVLLSPSLTGILTLMELSRDAGRRIRFNFAWSAMYNSVAILFAAGAFVHARLPPEYAGLGEAVSVLPVVLVGLQMRWRGW